MLFSSNVYVQGETRTHKPEIRPCKLQPLSQPSVPSLKKIFIIILNVYFVFRFFYSISERVNSSFFVSFGFCIYWLSLIDTFFLGVVCNLVGNSSSLGLVFALGRLWALHCEMFLQSTLGFALVKALSSELIFMLAFWYKSPETSGTPRGQDAVGAVHLSLPCGSGPDLPSYTGTFLPPQLRMVRRCCWSFGRPGW